MSQLNIGPVLPPGYATNKDENEEGGNVFGPVLPQHLKQGTHPESDSDNDEDSAAIGPALPPHLQLKKDQQLTRSEIGPSLPRSQSEDEHSEHSDNDGPDEQFGIGPVLPPTFKKSSEIDDDSKHREFEKRDGDDCLGPALPPGFRRPKHSHDDDDDDDNDDRTININVIGPVLPPGFAQPTAAEIDEDPYGPSLPPGFQKPVSQSGPQPGPENTIGPLPSEMMTGDISKSMALDFEQRARQMKSKLTEKNEPAPTQRESWMTEIPTGMKKNFGLTARTFSTKAVVETDKDTSVWTDTPADKERKLREAEKKMAAMRYVEPELPELPPPSSSKRRKDKEHGDHKKHKSKRGESLLEKHQKDRKKKKKKEKEKSMVRQPFDRDRDLQVNKFDDAQRKSIIKKSRELNTRFNHGGSTSSFI